MPQSLSSESPLPAHRAISLAHLSLISAAPEQLVATAADTGFDLVDLRLAPATADDRVYGNAERLQVCRGLLPLLRVTGLKVWNVEIIRVDEQTEPEDYLPLMEAAGLLGARRLKTVCDCQDESLAATLLSRLAELAAPFGLTVDLEYMVFSGIRSLGTALAVTRATSQPNLQILVDALHWMRAGDTIADIRAAPAGSIGYCELCDGPRQAPAGREALITEARARRLPPGQGEFPLRALLDVMPSDCPVSIEVPLPPGADPAYHARRLLAAARGVIERKMP